MKSLEERIREAYQVDPHAGSQEILTIVGCKNTIRFRESLVAVQQGLRNYSASRRQNHNAHPYRRT